MTLSSRAALAANHPASKIASGHVLDYAPGKCIDDNKDVRCTKPFLVTKSTCYEIKWSTDGALSHTTAEVRDAGSNEIVYYRDTDGQWTPEKGEVSHFLSLGPRSRRALHRKSLMISWSTSTSRFVDTPITLSSHPPILYHPPRSGMRLPFPRRDHSPNRTYSQTYTIPLLIHADIIDIELNSQTAQDRRTEGQDCRLHRYYLRVGLNSLESGDRKEAYGRM